MGTEFQLWERKNFGGGWWQWRQDIEKALNATETYSKEMFKMVDFVLRIFYHNQR